MIQQKRFPRALAALLALMLTLSLTITAISEAAAPQPLMPLYLNPGADLMIYNSANDTDVSGFVLQSGMACLLLGEQGGFIQILYLNPAGIQTAGWVQSGSLREKTEADAPSYGIVNSPDHFIRVPLYQKASAKAKTHGKYYNGVVVQVLDNRDKHFVKVRIGSLEGFMPRAQLLLDAPYGSVVSSQPHPTVQHPKYYGLTLRAAQSFQSEKLGAVQNGGSVTVLGVTEDFAHVMLDGGQMGFMQASALIPQPVYADVDPGVLTPEPKGMETVIDNPDGQGAHLRRKGSSKSDSLGLYLNGTRVIVTGGTTWWRKVWVDGKTGYMMAKLLRGFVPKEGEGEDY
ncbi:MAG: SH3 domain-containing protein [Clostridiales bacterium]|nr:SH3 domain-containing protein [Clostridiales bacterium]